MSDQPDSVSIGMVGLGRMGANLSRRAVAAGHTVVGFDRNTDFISALSEYEVQGAESLQQLVEALPVPRTVWIMVPAGPPTQSVVDELATLLESGDTIIDGGNSYYRDDIAHTEQLAPKGLHSLT